jgi:hypothetical protein
MYHLEILVNEKIRELQREAEQARLAAKAPRKPTSMRARVGARTLSWVGRRLSYWGDQLQKEYEHPALG